jgi:hypothetical protein
LLLDTTAIIRVSSRGKAMAPTSSKPPARIAMRGRRAKDPLTLLAKEQREALLVDPCLVEPAADPDPSLRETIHGYRRSLGVDVDEQEP